MKFESAKAVGLAAGAILSAAAASSASADTVTGAGFYPTAVIGYEGTISGVGTGTFTRLTGPIQVNFDGSENPIWVFCVDWLHEIGTGLGYQASVSYDYSRGIVTTDSTGALSGAGNPLSQTVSGEIQTLINLGVVAANSGTATDDELSGYQAAIWDIEYGLTQGPGDATASEIATINGLIAYAEANPYDGYARAFFSADGMSQALGTNVPEPAAWSLMLLGLGGLGGALRSRRKALAA